VVNASRLARSYASCDFDLAFLDSLRPEIDACGENGEFFAKHKRHALDDPYLGPPGGRAPGLGAAMRSVDFSKVPKGLNTAELGSFFGIRSGDRLAAMAGERLKVDGYTEVRAVCTHPDHLGKGQAAALMRTVMRGILERGETPFIPEPTMRGRSRYMKFGFLHQEAGDFVVLERE
jgi:hypothetical protein